MVLIVKKNKIYRHMYEGVLKKKKAVHDSV